MSTLLRWWSLIVKCKNNVNRKSDGNYRCQILKKNLLFELALMFMAVLQSEIKSSIWLIQKVPVALGRFEDWKVRHSDRGAIHRLSRTARPTKREREAVLRQVGNDGRTIWVIRWTVVFRDRPSGGFEECALWSLPFDYRDPCQARDYLSILCQVSQSCNFWWKPHLRGLR